MPRSLQLRSLSRIERRVLEQKLKDLSLSARVHQRYRTVSEVAKGRTIAEAADRIGCEPLHGGIRLGAPVQRQRLYHLRAGAQPERAAADPARRAAAQPGRGGAIQSGRARAAVFELVEASLRHRRHLNADHLPHIGALKGIAPRRVPLDRIEFVGDSAFLRCFSRRLNRDQHLVAVTALDGNGLDFPLAERTGLHRVLREPHV